MTPRRILPLWMAMSALLSFAACGDAPKPAEIQIEPNDAALQAGDEQKFEAAGIRPNGAPMQISPEWAVEGGVGEIDEDGLFTARRVGEGAVIAKVGEVGARASVRVAPGAPATLSLETEAEEPEAGSEIVLIARVLDDEGNPIPGVAVELSTETEGAALSETSVETGLEGVALARLRLAGRVVGNRVVAQAGELSADLLLGTVPGPPGLVEIDTRPARVLPGGSSRVRVTVSDAHGNLLEGVDVSFGALAPGASLDRANVSTDSIGAAIVLFTTSERAGENAIEISVPGLEPHRAGVWGVTLARIEVTPNSASIEAAGEQGFTATGFDETGTEVPVDVHWGITGGIGSIDESGTFVGGRTGAGAVVATAHNVTGTASVTVFPGALESIQVSPGQVEVESGTTARFVCRGVDVAGNEVPVEQPEWTVTEPLGTIDEAGVLTARQVGRGQVTASAQGISAQADVIVVPGGPAQLILEPIEIRLVAGETQLFTVKGRDEAGNEVAVTPTWTVSGGIGEISPEGAFRALNGGSGEVVAVFQNIATRARIEVAAGELAAIEIQPGRIELESGRSLAFSAVGRDAYGNVVEIESAWSGSREVGTMDAAGRFTAVTVGEGEIVATVGSIAGKASVTVIPGQLARLEMEPSGVELVAGEDQTFEVTGYDRAGNEKPVDPEWTVEGALGEFSAPGVFLARTAGTGSVRAAVGDLAASSLVTVMPAALAQVVVAPGTVELRSGEVREFEAVGHDAFDNAVEIDPSWTVTGGVGVIESKTGRFEARTAGTGRVVATVGPIGGSADVIVTHGELATIQVTSSSASLEAGSTAAFTAVGRDAHGNEVPVDPEWTVTADIGTIDVQGFFLADSAGEGQVVATLGDIGGSVRVTVSPGVLAAIEVSPADTSCISGETVDFTAVGRDAHGNEVAIEVRWSVDGEVGTLDEAGILTCTRAGPGSIRAAVGSIQGAAAAEVVPGEILTLAVRPETAHVVSGESESFTATGLDLHGNEQTITVTWSVTAGVGRIDENGRFTATRAGEGQVFAVHERRTGMAQVTTTPGALAELIIEPASAEARSGTTLRFTARGRDAAGNPIPDLDVRWSSPGDLGSIDPATGLWTAVRAGTGRVVASVGNVAAEATVTLRPGEPSRDRSSVSVSPDSVAADGETPAEVSVVVRDQFNNPIPGAAVSVTSDRPDVAIELGAETTDENGVMTASVTSETAGIVLLTVSVDGITVGAGISVRFQGVGVDQGSLP